MQKVLITGCAGFIGCHLVNFFINKGFEVTGIDNLSRKGSEVNLEWLKNLNGKNFNFYKEDIRNFKGITDIFLENKSFDLIIHEAAQVAVTTSVTNPREDFEINALGTFNMLEATRLYSPEAFFEFASTNKVYGEMLDMGVIERNNRYEYTKEGSGISEEYCLDFHSPYGCSKGTADQYVRDYSRIYGLKTVVLRQSCIYGTRQFGVEDQGWVAWFIIASILRKPVTIYGDGKQTRDILWIEDLVEVYNRLFLEKEKVKGSIFNVGGGSQNILSLLELVKILQKEKIMISFPALSDWRPGDQKTYVSDIKKIRQTTSWEPKTAPEQGVITLINWCRENKQVLEKLLK